MLIPVFWMLALRLVAAFCAAENMDERKLVPAFESDAPSLPSVDRDRDEGVKLDDLLGPIAAEADVLLLCVLMFRADDWPSVPEPGSSSGAEGVS
jgi:hypothetical protein